MQSRLAGVRGGSLQLLDGFKIPLFGLGTYKLRSASDVMGAVDAALANGYRLFDTAHTYENEADLGIAFKVGL